MITRQSDATPENLAFELELFLNRLKLKKLEDAFYFPQYFQLETVRVCNAKCTFCAIDEWDKSTPVMKDPLFNKVVLELGQFADWIKMVAIQRAGEPLLDKKIVKRVKMLKDVGIRNVSMSTNASLLFEKKARELLEAGLDEIMISIDSVEKESYEQMRVGLEYETVMENIETFFKVREELRPDMVVRVRGVSLHDTETPSGKQELEAWEEFWGKYKKSQDRIYMKRAHNWGNQIAFDGCEENGDVFHPCILPWSTMHITAMGKIALCPMDYDAKIDLGDVNTTSIQEIWQNNKWAHIRKLHATGSRNEIAMCRGCKLFDLDFSLEKKEEAKQLYEGA